MDGKAFSDGQARELRVLLAEADERTGLRFRVHVGRADGKPRRYAEGLLTGLDGEVERGVLIFVDPAARVLEIVTGAEARRYVDDTGCALAAATMVSSFDAGDLPGGLRAGIHQLADRAEQSIRA